MPTWTGEVVSTLGAAQQTLPHLQPVAGARHLPTVTTVICCYTPERWPLLMAAIESILRQSQPAAQLLVVVDHCPALAATLRRTYPEVQVLENTGPQGLSGARNTGLAASTGEVVAFLDDDAVAAQDWLARLLPGYLDGSAVGVGGQVEPDWDDGRPRWFPPEFDWVVGCSHSGLPGAPAAVRNLIGANMSFRRRELAEAGGFRTELGRVGARPLGCEETEACIRLAELHPGMELRYRPAAVVHHHVPAQRGTWTYFRRRCFAEGQSKAAVARLAGARPALSAERAYVRRTLPRGLATGIGLTLRTRDPSGLARAGAIIAGLLVTGGGYTAGRVRAARPTLLRLLPLIIALALWAFSLRDIHLDAMTDLGLASVLPMTYWIALALAVGSLVTHIHRGRVGERVLAAHLLGVIVILYTLPSILYGAPRYAWTWKHIGIVDFIVRNHDVVPHSGGAFSGYQAWPGFFSTNALLVQGGGLDTALSYAGWAQPAFALLAFIPLRLLFGTFSTSRRHVWLAMLVFYLSNWVGQDYFSPQAFAYLLFLVVLVVCLRWLPAKASSRPPRRRLRWLAGDLPGRPAAGQASRPAMLAVVVLLMAAIVVSHQLTPLMLFIALSLLVLGRHIGPAWLPWLLAAMAVAWGATVGSTFLSQNLYWIAESFGNPASNSQTLVSLTDVTISQRVVDYTDRGLTLALCALAILGFWRMRRAGSATAAPVLLAVSPLPMLVLNNYGGEMLFRVFFFSLPFLALLAAGLIYPGQATPTGSAHAVPGRRRLARSVALPLVLALALSGAFSLAYYGKERMNYFSPQEVNAAQWLYANAPMGSMIVDASANSPWAFTHYDYFNLESLANLTPQQLAALPLTPADVLHEAYGDVGKPIFLILNRANAVAIHYTGDLPPNILPSLTAGLPKLPGVTIIYQNADATIYQLSTGGTP